MVIRNGLVLDPKIHPASCSGASYTGLPQPGKASDERPQRDDLSFCACGFDGHAHLRDAALYVLLYVSETDVVSSGHRIPRPGGGDDPQMRHDETQPVCENLLGLRASSLESRLEYQLSP